MWLGRDPTLNPDLTQHFLLGHDPTYNDPLMAVTQAFLDFWTSYDTHTTEYMLAQGAANSAVENKFCKIVGGVDGGAPASLK